jgi:hypothetical protein
VWDFFRTFASTAAVRSVSLPDDCAPVQVFRTGATGNSTIRVYLPTAPIEGKQITIANQRYSSGTQYIQIYSSDTNGSGADINSALYTLGQGESIILVYSKQAISFGISGGIYSSGWISLNKANIASANYNSAIAGGNNNAATSVNCFIGGGTSHTASGEGSSIVGGSSNAASGQNSSIVGGYANGASNASAFIGGGFGCNATNSYSSVVGGLINTASGDASIVLGGNYGTTRGIAGNFVAPASVSPITALAGAQQTATLLLGRQTTDATATVLRSNTSAAGTQNQIILPNNSAYTFQGTCIANVTGGGTTSGWKFEGVIKRGANAGTTALVAAVTPTVIAQDVGAVTWVLAITADTTNGGIAVTVTGAASTTIRWVCKIETTEVTF